MESKTILIVEHDYLLRQRVRESVHRNFPAARILDYILAGQVLREMKRLRLDLVITGDQLLDSSGKAFAAAARRQMPLLPIITLIEEDCAEPVPPTRLDRYVPKNSIDSLLVPAVLAMLNSESVILRAAPAAFPAAMPAARAAQKSPTTLGSP